MTLDLTQLLKLINETAAYRQLVKELSQSDKSHTVMVLDAAKPYLIAALYQSLRRAVFVITAQPEDAQNLHEQLSTWLSTATPRRLPEPDTLPYQHISSDATTEIERLQVLSALTGVNGNPDTTLVITSVMALTQKIVSRHDFTTIYHKLKMGQEIEPLSLLKRWQMMGYRLENMVEIPGTVSHRGGIVDIYPPSSELPARVEFYGNTVDTIRLFDPMNQRSQRAVTEIAITAATELSTPLLSSRGDLEPTLRNLDLRNCNPKASEEFRQDLALLTTGQRPENLTFYAPLFNRDSILSYLPQNTLIVLNEPLSLKSAAEDLDAKASELRTEKLYRGELPSNFPVPYLTWEELEAKINTRQRLTLSTWKTSPADRLPRLSFTTAPSYAGQLPTFLRKIKKLLGQKHRLIIISNQSSRLSELLSEEDIITLPLTQIREVQPPGSLNLVQGSLAKGWILSGNTHLITDYEIFGFRKERRMAKKHTLPHPKLLMKLVPDDYVVHIEHGIAQFSGMTTLTTNNRQREYLVLRYADNDKLYVPTDQIHRLSRYISASDSPPILSRLGTPEWTRTKERARNAVASIAQELVVLYAARAAVPGFAFSPDTPWQEELEASFPYVETPDQIEVLGQVKEDMIKPKPMDRLVCGDVGYGKTEIAVRAAFKAVMDNKQVAILAPTTVLAQQHLATFSQRLSSFPVRIEVLSRFRTPREQSEILNGLARGRVDICIGTHRLLQKDVLFKNLGLLIIDEEQRFGVTHKEYLKQKRHEVDVLTLSATPIPRTLHMSLVGVRDMSTMETPPEDRLPIKTYVAQFDDSLVREAILRELGRNGQVFFVHNRVVTISMVADRLQSLVPEAKVAIAHGQMPEGKLEKVMALFTQGKIDVLVCTTIIESGLDLPNVNTLIVHRADRLGLTQLYQLRGRVGRGSNLAHAYFLYERGERLTDTAVKRLKTIFEATKLGSGFNIAIRDLEIRGAGTLLGTKQSGHISAVGFNLYCRLLTEAIDGEKARIAKITPQPPHPPTPTIDLPLHAYIPEDYVANLATRISFYQRLADITLDATSAEKIEAIADEFSDRFGKLPREVTNLLYSVNTKALATRAGIESIVTEHGWITLLPFEGMHFDRHKLKRLQREGLKIGLNQIRINYTKVAHWQHVLAEVLKGVGRSV